LRSYFKFRKNRAHEGSKIVIQLRLEHYMCTNEEENNKNNIDEIPKKNCWWAKNQKLN